MEAEANEITLNGKTYVVKDAITPMAASVDGMRYCMVRANRSGVFAGYVKSQDVGTINGTKVVILKARRIWHWEGAATLSQLATEGTSNPSGCKFPCEVPEVTLLDAIEIIPCTNKAQGSIASVPVWEK